jgi:predicted DNA binding CopG/RHH family protein
VACVVLIDSRTERELSLWGPAFEMGDKEQKTMSIRVGLEALEAAKIAAAYKGLTVMDYVTALVFEAANRDIEEGHRARSAPPVKTRRTKDD